MARRSLASRVNEALLTRDTTLIDKTELPTSRGKGKWTKWMEYDQENKILTVCFRDDHVQEYFGVSPKQALAAYEGVTTKDGRPWSTGAWLHQNLI